MGVWGEEWLEVVHADSGGFEAQMQEGVGVKDGNFAGVLSWDSPASVPLSAILRPPQKETVIDGDLRGGELPVASTESKRTDWVGAEEEPAGDDARGFQAPVAWP